MKLRDLYREGAGCPIAAGIEEAEYDARALLLSVLGCDLAGYVMRSEDEADEETAAAFRALVRRREAREPLQYILCCADFMGRTFLVTPSVLIPRFDTEILVEEALKYCRPGMRVLDLCTGSGCILLTLMKEVEGLEGTGTDISRDALAVARENARRLDAEAAFVCSDLTCGIIDGKFDLIVSNPPYIKSAEIGILEPEVRCHEPISALDGGEDGLSFYRIILSEAGEHLAPGGAVVLEAGADTAEAVLEMAGQYFEKTELVRDLSGRPRVVTSSVYKK